MQKVRHFLLTALLILLQILFTPFFMVLFIYSLTVLFLYQSFQSILQFESEFPNFQFLFVTKLLYKFLVLYGTYPVSFNLIIIYYFFYKRFICTFLLISLAVTFNISVDFFFSYYLEVSVCKVFFFMVSLFGYSRITAMLILIFDNIVQCTKIFRYS